ncbi:MAG TPA: ABC transporter permease subunit [Clostridia bacterium]
MIKNASLFRAIPQNNEYFKRSNKKIRINNPKNDKPLKMFLVIIFILSAISILLLGIDWLKLGSRFLNLLHVFTELSKFDFTNFNFTAVSFLESASAAVLATLYSIVLGLVMAFFTARNITPFKPLSVILSAYNSFVRAVPTTVWVLLILACIGFGPAPGIIGLSFHATAFFSRTFTQAFEETPRETIEALESCGAGRLQIFFCGVLPSSFTSLVAWSALRFEINFSESAILGMVGAGGIGYSIEANMASYCFGQAGIAILMVFIFAFSLEIMFTSLKRRLKV